MAADYDLAEAEPAFEEQERVEWHEPEAVPEPPKLPFAGANIPKLVRDLRGSPKIRDKALAKLRILSSEPDKQVAIVKAGAIEPLVDLLGPDNISRPCERAAAILMNLAFTRDHQTPIADAGAIQPLVKMLQGQEETGHSHAAGALKNLANKHPDNRIAIANAGAIPVLVRLIAAAQATFDVQERGVGALKNLAANSPTQRSAITKAGGILPLTVLLDSTITRVVEQAAGALRNIVHDNSASLVMFEEAGTIPKLRALLKHSLGGVRLQAAAALKNINALRPALVKESVALIYDEEALLRDADDGEVVLERLQHERDAPLMAALTLMQPKTQLLASLTYTTSSMYSESFDGGLLVMGGGAELMCRIKWSSWQHVDTKVDSSGGATRSGFGGSYFCPHSVTERVSKPDFTEVQVYPLIKTDGPAFNAEARPWGSYDIKSVAKASLKDSNIVGHTLNPKLFSLHPNCKTLYAVAGDTLYGFEISLTTCKLAWKEADVHGGTELTLATAASNGEVFVTGDSNGGANLWGSFTEQGQPQGACSLPTPNDAKGYPVLAAAVAGTKAKRLVCLAYGGKGYSKGFLKVWQVDEGCTTGVEVASKSWDFEEAAGLLLVGSDKKGGDGSQLLFVSGGKRVEAWRLEPTSDGASLSHVKDILKAKQPPSREFDSKQFEDRYRTQQGYGSFEATQVTPSALQAPPMALAPRGRHVVIGYESGLQVWDVSGEQPKLCVGALSQVQGNSDIHTLSLPPVLVPGKDKHDLGGFVLLTGSKGVQVELKHRWDADVHWDTGDVQATAEQRSLEPLDHAEQKVWRLQL